MSTVSSILRRRDVETRVGLRRSSLYEKIQRGEFPAPVKLGKRAVGWLEAEVDAWVEARISESRGSL